MRAVYWNNLRPYEVELGSALKAGAERCGDIVEFRPVGDWRLRHINEDAVPIIAGTQYSRLPIAKQCQFAQRRYIHLDKGMHRPGGDRRNWVRFSIDAHQPSRFLLQMDIMPPDRRRAHGWNFSGWNGSERGHILYCPAGRRECDWYDLGDPNDLAERTVRTLQDWFPGREIRFRPKAPHVEGGQFRTAPAGTIMDTFSCPIERSLEGASWLVTYSSSATLNAVLAGVPVLCAGPNWAWDLGRTNLGALPKSKEVVNALNKLAYLHWTLEEWRNGSAWSFLRGVLK